MAIKTSPNNSDKSFDKVQTFVVLLHSPMLNRKGDEVTTAVTNLDIHDIARSCKTYGIKKYFIVNPEPEQEKLVNRILGHWHEDVNLVYHPARAQALEIVQFFKSFEEAVAEATRLAGGAKPFVVMPDAKELPGALSYAELRKKIEEKDWNLSSEIENKNENSQERSLMFVFGTGWGISPRFYDQIDVPLKPLKGAQSYNHLSVRAAAAIVLDRVLGQTQ